MDGNRGLLAPDIRQPGRIRDFETLDAVLRTLTDEDRRLARLLYAPKPKRRDPRPHGHVVTPIQSPREPYLVKSADPNVLAPALAIV